MSDRKDLPAPTAPNFNQRLRETIQTYLGKQGDPLDRGLTLRDLIDAGVVKFKTGFSAASASSGGSLALDPVSTGTGTGTAVEVEPDLTPPPQPNGFAVTAAISHVFIEHNAPIYAQGHGHLRTRVYGAIVESGDPLPTFAEAVEVGQFSGQVWAMPSDPGITWRLWIKWETQDAVLSPTPAGGTNGLEAITGQNVGAMVQAMTGTGKPFTVLNQTQTIGGVTFPTGIYATNAFIMDLQVTGAKIANLAVDNAKIANLSADKITAGTIAADRLNAETITSKVLSVSWAKITNAQITSAQIVSLDANKISAASLSAISANLGVVTAGSISINGKFIVDAAGNATLKSASSGARLEIKNNVIKVFDSNNILRVHIGDLTV